MFELFIAYGLTEMSPGVMMSPLGNKKLGSCGSLFSRTQAKVVDLETGQRALGPYEDGELFVTGPQVMKGYHKNQKATDEMIGSDGWLRTGDIGHYDDDGHFFIVDRLKELIKVKAFQVNSVYNLTQQQSVPLTNFKIHFVKRLLQPS